MVFGLFTKSCGEWINHVFLILFCLTGRVCVFFNMILMFAEKPLFGKAVSLLLIGFR
jgi:hypothetical protein